jgi:hypothetical protein
VIPISSGEPAALTLLPGSYWLAWQSDSTSEVLGFIPGAPDSGYRRINNEPFDNLQGPYFGDAVHNDEQFSIYLQGRGTSATAQWEMYE